MFDFDELEETLPLDKAKEAKEEKKPETQIAEKPSQPSPAAMVRLRPSPLGRKLRVLGLHGGGSNSNILQYQVMALKKALGDKAEWDFLNGGRDWKFNDGQEPPAIMKSLANGMPFYGWYGVVNQDTSDRPYQEKLFDISVDFEYQEVEEGVNRVMKYMKEKGPFDVLLGFSQGCIVSHLIAGLLHERGETIPWRLSLLFCGMRVRDNRYRRLFEVPLDVPSVMVFGRQDEFYDYGKASQVELYKDPIILEHDEGHRFPSQQPRAKEIYEEVVKQVYWHCGVDG
eukprot:TRINITY_DN5149_c2_g1_i3.p1 TRINITY_DN5149_c2_g1~~TRINITY_DN5149_c2_g1_i3.p1  ORF type:complete len:303 (+),score=52.32 TRINITY_DN5149_c2_g1_i3:59-910(+)